MIGVTMGIPKHARRDGNEPEIVNYFRRFGATVTIKSDKDAPDLEVGYEGITVLVEVKTNKGKLRSGQIEWHKNYQGCVFVVRNIQQAQYVLTYCENLASIGRGVYETAEQLFYEADKR